MKTFLINLVVGVCVWGSGFGILWGLGTVLGPEQVGPVIFAVIAMGIVSVGIGFLVRNLFPELAIFKTLSRWEKK